MGPEMEKWFAEKFCVYFGFTASQVHHTAREKGWWDKERNDGECIMLVVTELSEAIEALRQGNKPDDKIPEFSGAEAEIADAVIRLMDLSIARKWRIADAIVAKMKFNETREKMHGGKKF